MKSNTQILLTLSLMVFCSGAYAFELSEEIEREQASAINSINEYYESVSDVKTARAVLLFPTERPADAYSAYGWDSYDDQFDIHVWRESGSVWMEIEPAIGHYPFICGPSWTILQNGAQYDDTKIEKVGGSSQCSDLYVSSIFLLTQWRSPYPDWDSSFTLVFDDYKGQHFLEIPAKGGGGTNPTPSCDLNGDGNVDKADFQKKIQEAKKSIGDWRGLCVP